jgi:hypothetical protein
MKKLIVIVLAVVLVLVIAVVAVAFSLDSGVKAAVEQGGTYALKVPVTLDEADVSVTSGQAALRGLTIANPEGFKTARAVYLGEAAVEIKLGSVTSDVIEVPEIRVIKPELTVEGSVKGSNISKLIKNLDETMADLPSGGEGEKPAEEKPEGPEQKYKVGRILITDATLKLSATFMEGKESSAVLKKVEIVPGDEPMTMAQLMKKVLGQLLKEGAKSPGQAGKMLGGVVVNTGLGSVEKVGEAVKTGTEKAGEVGKKVGDKLKGLFNRKKSD